jgi:hypothetical protein
MRKLERKKMKKLVLAGKLFVVVILLASVYCLGKQGVGTDTAAILLLQNEGYSDIKVIDSNYITAPARSHSSGVPFLPALDSIVVSAQKDGAPVKLKVCSIGLPEMSIEKL